jgi:hypothetical protein
MLFAPAHMSRAKLSSVNLDPNCLVGIERPEMKIGLAHVGE